MTGWEYIQYDQINNLVFTGKDKRHSVVEALKARLAELDRVLKVSEEKWYISIKKTDLSYLNVLNALGAEGWEAVGYNPNGPVCLLKRPTGS